MTDNENQIFKNSEAIFNWTYPGATLYYKDCDMKQDVVDRFKTGMILRNGYFLDVSWKGAGIKFNTRFLVASSKAAKLYEINPNNEKYGHCCINANSYFKVLDIYNIGDKTQIFLLHIPAQGIKFFSHVVSNTDDDFIKKARQSFDNKINMAPLPELLEPFWLERTNFPACMDGYNRFYPIDRLTPITGQSEALYNGIKKLTHDETEINVPIAVHEEAGQKKSFWKRLFGSN